MARLSSWLKQCLTYSSIGSSYSTYSELHLLDYYQHRFIRVKAENAENSKHMAIRE